MQTNPAYIPSFVWTEMPWKTGGNGGVVASNYNAVLTGLAAEIATSKNRGVSGDYILINERRASTITNHNPSIARWASTNTITVTASCPTCVAAEAFYVCLLLAMVLTAVLLTRRKS